MAITHLSHTTENTLTIQSTRELPASEHRDPRAITYECELTGGGRDGARKLVVLRITHQPADIDLESGQRLPARFEAEIAPPTGPGSAIPFAGLRVCWAGAPRFSQRGMEAFAEIALSRLAHKYLVSKPTPASTDSRSPMHQHTTNQTAAQRLRRLKALVAERANTEWGREEIEDELAQDPDSPDATCPRFAGIIEESCENAVILADTQEELAFDMARRLTSEIPISPIELVDLDTQQHRLAFCEATVRFAPVPVDDPGADHETRSERKAMTNTPDERQPSDQNDTATQVTEQELRDPDRTDHDDHEITFVWNLGEDRDGGTRQAVVRLNHHKHARGGAFSAVLLNQTEQKTPSVTEQCMGAITEWTRIADEPVARYSNTQLKRFADGALERLRSLYGQDSHEGRRVRGYFQVKS